MIHIAEIVFLSSVLFFSYLFAMRWYLVASLNFFSCHSLSLQVILILPHLVNTRSLLEFDKPHIHSSFLILFFASWLSSVIFFNFPLVSYVIVHNYCSLMHYPWNFTSFFSLFGLTFWTVMLSINYSKLIFSYIRVFFLSGFSFMNIHGTAGGWGGYLCNYALLFPPASQVLRH